ELDARAETEWEVVPVEGQAEAAPRAAPAPLDVELEDAFGRVFTARFVAVEDARASRSGVRTGAYRGLLTRATDDGREALCAVWMAVTECDLPRRTEVHLVLENDPLPGEPVVGTVRFRRLTVRSTDPAQELFARHGTLLAMARRQGRTLDLVGPSEAIYLGDRTRKAFLVELVPADDGSGQASLPPIEAWPDAQWVRHTAAYGLHGGPGPAALRSETVRPPAPFWQRLDGGPVGALMAPRDLTHTAFGWPPSTLHPLVGRGLDRELEEARATVLQGGLRPPPLLAARAPVDTDYERQGLTPAALLRPHGYVAFDYEHVTADLPFEVHWWTADPFARAELVRLALAVPGLLATPAFRTSRGEGACLRAGVAAARAIGDGRLLARLVAHVADVLEPVIGDEDPRRAHAIAQPPDVRALGPRHPFDAPWQMGLLVHGLHALWLATGDDLTRTLATRVARRMAGPCWSAEEGLAGFVSAVDPNVRAASPTGDRGAQGIAVGAFVLAAEMAEEEELRALLLDRARRMAEDADAAGAPAWVTELWRDRRARSAGRD
ncbi:MAG: hypothetical protein ACO3UM_02385, partial [Planctomycetota bacterium]